MMTNNIFLFLEAFLLHHFLVLALFSSRRVDGFTLQRPSGLPVSSTAFGVITAGSVTTKGDWLKSSASAVNNFAFDGKFPDTNSSLNDNRESSYEEIESSTAESYPWSKLQQWALRDNLPKYIFRIPIKQKASLTETSAKNQEDTVLSPFALWRSLQQDVPELSGYPIDFLQARYEEMNRAKQEETEVADDKDGTTIRVEPPITPGVLPFLQDYEFSAGGGICGYVYGMDGVSDGSRIETSAVKNIKESLPKGFIQTSDGYASFELGNPSQIDEPAFDTGTISSSLETVSKAGTATTNEMRSLLSNVDDGDGMLLRLGALSGFVLAGATAINMLSHHLTVNVFWV